MTDPLLERLSDIVYLAPDDWKLDLERELRALMADVAIEYAFGDETLRVDHRVIDGVRQPVLLETDAERKRGLEIMTRICQRFGVEEEKIDG